MPVKDRTGEVYGNYLVLEYAYSKNNKAYWRCRCTVCGEDKIRCVSLFKKDKLTKHCSSCSWKRNFKGYEGIPMTHWSRIVKQAKDRGLVFDLTIEEAWDRYTEQDGRCFYTNEPIVFSKFSGKIVPTASLDRMDSGVGYTKSNINWVHKDVNIMKGSLSHERFVEICSKVVNEPKVMEIK